MNKKLLFQLKLFGLVISLILLIASCSSGPSPAGQSSGPSSGSTAAQQDTFDGAGRHESLGQALALAKIDAVRKAVVELIGAGAEQANREKLDEVLYSSRNPNSLVYPETMETLRKENLGTTDQFDMVYEIRIRVRLDVIQDVLRANGIGGGSGDDTRVASGNDQQQRNTPPPPPVVELTPEQQRFIQRYTDTMTYMVYYNEDEFSDPFLVNAALTQANRYLATEGLTVIDSSQIEQLKEDAALLYEEQTGGEISLIQWIAQRLNADVYVEINGSSTGETRRGRHYGQAIITLKLYETSTAQLLGSVPYSSPETISTVDPYDAQANAITSSVFNAIPVAVDQLKGIMAQQYANGIRYQVNILNTVDSRMMSEFRRELRREVADVETVSQTPDETNYVIFFFGRIDELEDLIYDIADGVPGLEDIDTVLIRGKTITFDSGL